MISEQDKLTIQSFEKILICLDSNIQTLKMLQERIKQLEQQVENLKAKLDLLIGRN